MRLTKQPWFKPFQDFGTVIWRVWRQMRDSDTPILAGSLAFSTVISLVPLLAVSLSVFTAYGGLESLLNKIEPFILQNLVEASGAEISRGIRRAIQRVHSGALGFGGVVGLFLASTKLFYDIERAVHRVWHIRSDRSLWKRLLIYWIVMFAAPLVLAVILGLLGSKDLGFVAWIPKRTIALSLALVSFVCIYKYIPSRPVRWRASIISALFATACLGVVQEAYAVVVKKILYFNKIYGSLASVPIFLLWLLVLWWICLAGVALCAVIERDRTGEPDPATDPEL